MAYDKKKLIKKALQVIKNDPHVVFIDDLANLMGISRATFYNQKLDKLDVIRDALTDNKADLRKLLRIKWAISDNATAQEKLYRLIATNDEYERLVGASYNVRASTDTKIIIQDGTEFGLP